MYHVKNSHHRMVSPILLTTPLNDNVKLFGHYGMNACFNTQYPQSSRDATNTWRWIIRSCNTPTMPVERLIVLYFPSGSTQHPEHCELRLCVCDTCDRPTVSFDRPTACACQQACDRDPELTPTGFALRSSCRTAVQKRDSWSCWMT
jgi:hypothetical protein